MTRMEKNFASLSSRMEEGFAELRAASGAMQRSIEEMRAASWAVQRSIEELRAEVREDERAMRSNLIALSTTMAATGWQAARPAAPSQQAASSD